jgi:hypothetical protein
MSEQKPITVMWEFDRPERFYKKENGRLREEIDTLRAVISDREKEIAGLRAKAAAFDKIVATVDWLGHAPAWLDDVIAEATQ